MNSQEYLMQLQESADHYHAAGRMDKFFSIVKVMQFVIFNSKNGEIEVPEELLSTID